MCTASSYRLFEASFHDALAIAECAEAHIARTSSFSISRLLGPNLTTQLHSLRSHHHFGSILLLLLYSLTVLHATIIYINIAVICHPQQQLLQKVQHFATFDSSRYHIHTASTLLLHTLCLLID